MYRHIQNIKGVSFFGILRFLYKFKGSSCEEELVAMLTKEEQKVLDIEDSRYAHFMITIYRYGVGDQIPKKWFALNPSYSNFFETKLLAKKGLILPI